MDIIRSRAEQLGTLLRASEAVTQDACATLEVFRRKLREVDRMIQPVSQRANTISQVRESLRVARAQVDEVVDNLDTAKQVEAAIVTGPSKDFSGFLRAFERLEASINFLQGHEDVVAREVTLKDSLRLREMGVRMALDNFAELLRTHTTVPAPALLWEQGAAIASGNPGHALELMPVPVCRRLRRLSELLLRNGETRCLTVYSDARGGVLRQAVSGLGDEGLVKDPNVTWEVLQDKIDCWIRGMAAAAAMTRPERMLAEAVLPPAHVEDVYYAVAEPVLRSLIILGAALCQAPRKHAEKLFGMLDMHDNLAQLLPPMASLLEGAKVQRALVAFVSLDSDLQLECRATFQEFVGSIRTTNTRPSPDGSVDRFVVYVLNYVKRLVTMYDTARHIVFSVQPPHDIMDAGRAYAPSDPQLPERTAAQLRGTMDLLIKSCELKAKTYRSKALGALFMMNNVHHIVTRVEKSEGMAPVGMEWIEGCKDAVEAFGGEYIDSAWGPLIGIVQTDPEAVGKEKVKDHLKALSTRLEEIQAHETTWQIPDEVLRENLRDVIAEDFVKPYEAYVGRFRSVFPSKADKYANKYQKFSVADVRMIIFHKLFTGEQDKGFKGHPDMLLESVGR